MAATEVPTADAAGGRYNRVGVNVDATTMTRRGIGTTSVRGIGRGRRFIGGETTWGENGLIRIRVNGGHHNYRLMRNRRFCPL